MQKFWCVSMFVFLVSLSLSAQPKKLGVGVVLGFPTGLSVKYWESSSIAYQGTLGGGFGGVTVGADYLIHTDALKNREFPFYYGAGIVLGEAGIGSLKRNTNSVALGIRGVAGVTYIFPQHPFDVAVEVGPALFLVPTVGIGIEMGVAFRFYP